MFDFEEVRRMDLPPKTTLDAHEVVDQRHLNGVGKITVEAVLAKFG